MGQPRGAASAREYHDLEPKVWEVVVSALGRLRADYDVIVIEGAGSPPEVNLKQHDIVNMRVALHADAPVLLVGDNADSDSFVIAAGLESSLGRASSLPTKLNQSHRRGTARLADRAVATAGASFHLRRLPGGHEVDIVRLGGYELVHATELVGEYAAQLRRRHHSQAHLVADDDPGRVAGPASRRFRPSGLTAPPAGPGCRAVWSNDSVEARPRALRPGRRGLCVRPGRRGSP